MHFEKFISSDRICNHVYYIILDKIHMHLTVGYFGGNFEEVCFMNGNGRAELKTNL